MLGSDRSDKSAANAAAFVLRRGGGGAANRATTDPPRQLRALAIVIAGIGDWLAYNPWSGCGLYRCRGWVLD
ncbi:MAG TPA: hypothetical protein VNT22_09115, partial [Baekduia sp.]|nr:hypothetical protein [Baekduia sp.]